MKANKCEINADGFYGRYYANRNRVQTAVILFADNSDDDFLIKNCAKWLAELQINILAITPEKGSKGCHSYPLEQVEAGIQYLKAAGNTKIGITGISAGATVALTAASFFPDITLTIALTPADFVMEGYYQDKKDGTSERPGNFESSLTWQGKPLPFLPYAYRHPEYWQKIVAEGKRRGDMLASKDLFTEIERLHPVRDRERIKVENINGHIYFAAAEDDVLWDACKYIRRMETRLKTLSHNCTYETHLYEHGTHFVFPEGVVRKMLPVGANLLLPIVFKEAKGHAKECQATRRDIEQTLIAAISAWKARS